MKKTMKKKSANRAKASLKQVQVHSDKLSAYQYDSRPGVLQKASTESLADRTLKDLMTTRVFKSNPKTIKEENSNARRYK